MSRRTIELIKKNISYDPITGEFKRLTASAPTKVGYKNKDFLIIRLYENDYMVTMQAWRVAFLLNKGFLPPQIDSCVFRDGNSLNLKFDNLELKPKLDDEFNAYEFAEDNNLSYQMVIRRMKGAPCIRRINNGNPQIYYRLQDFNCRCADMFDIDRPIKRRKKKVIVHRRNQLALDFLKKHFITPTRWEMSLI